MTDKKLDLNKIASAKVAYKSNELPTFNLTSRDPCRVLEVDQIEAYDSIEQHRLAGMIYYLTERQFAGRNCIDRTDYAGLYIDVDIKQDTAAPLTAAQINNYAVLIAETIRDSVDLGNEKSFRIVVATRSAVTSDGAGKYKNGIHFLVPEVMLNRESKRYFMQLLHAANPQFDPNVALGALQVYGSSKKNEDGAYSSYLLNRVILANVSSRYDVVMVDATKILDGANLVAELSMLPRKKVIFPGRYLNLTVEIPKQIDFTNMNDRLRINVHDMADAWVAKHGLPQIVWKWRNNTLMYRRIHQRGDPGVCPICKNQGISTTKGVPHSRDNNIYFSVTLVGEFYRVKAHCNKIDKAAGQKAEPLNPALPAAEYNKPVEQKCNIFDSDYPEPTPGPDLDYKEAEPSADVLAAFDALLSGINFGDQIIEAAPTAEVTPVVIPVQPVIEVAPVQKPVPTVQDVVAPVVNVAQVPEPIVVPQVDDDFMRVVAENYNKSSTGWAMIFAKKMEGCVKIYGGGKYAYKWNESTRLWESVSKTEMECITTAEVRDAVFDFREEKNKLQRSCKSTEVLKALEAENKLISKEYGKLLDPKPAIFQQLSVGAHGLKDETFPSRLNKSPYLLPLKSGMVLDLKKCETRLREKHDLFTFECPWSLKKEIDPAAIEDIRDMYGGNDDLINYVQEAIGYSMTGDVDAQKMFIFLGAGSNGKSVLMKLVAKLIGKFYYKAIMSHVTVKKASAAHSANLIMMAGARVIHVTEINDKEEIDENFIKDMTTGGTQPLRDAGQTASETKDYTFCGKLLFDANTVFKYRVSDEAMRRRLQFIKHEIRYTDKPEKPNDRMIKYGLADTLIDKYLDDIGSWFAIGAARCFSRGDKAKLSEPAVVFDMKNKEFKKADNVLNYYDEMIVKIPGPYPEDPKKHKSIRYAAMYDDYRKFCGSCDLIPLPSKEFHERMKSLEVPNKRFTEGLRYIHVEFRKFEEDAADNNGIVLGAI